MVNVLLIRNSSGGLEYLRRACRYLCDDERAVFIHGNGVNYLSIDKAYEQMVIVKRFYHKEFRNPLVHLIITFDTSVDTSDVAINHGKKIVDYFRDEYQFIWCIHEKDVTKGRYHMHLLINPVNVINGKLLHTSPDMLNGFCKYISKAIGIHAYGRFKKTERHD